MADDQNGLVPSFQSRQKLRVKDVLEVRVLISSPFIEHIDRAIFKIGSEKRETLTLILRKICGREFALLDLDLVGELQLLQVFPGLLIEFRAKKAQKLVEEEEIREYGGEVLAIELLVFRANRLILEINCA